MKSYQIEIDSNIFTFTEDQVKELISKLYGALSDSENYLALKCGDELWYVNSYDGILEKAVVYGIGIKDFKIDWISCDFPESGDFDEFDGKVLGDTFFINKELAEAKLNNKV